MQKLPVILLAAGKGTRLAPLTDTIPKPLLRIAGVPIIGHTLRQIQPYASEAIIVIGHKKEAFEQTIGTQFEGLPLRYVEQTRQQGTGHAAVQVRGILDSDYCYLLYGDDYYGSDLLKELAGKEGNSIIGVRKTDWQRYGVLVPGEDGMLADLVEKPEEFISDLVNTGAYKLNTAFLEEFERVQESPRGELELTDMVRAYAKHSPVRVVKSRGTWIPVGYPWDLLTLAEYLLSRMDSDIKGVIEVGAVVKGKLRLGAGSVIKAGAYLDGNIAIGENCTIGPNCYIRNFASIGDGCIVGASTEIKGSILGNGTKAPHLAYIPDSVLGNNVNYAAGCVTANLKHDDSNVRAMIKGELIDTGRRKFGTVIGDNARLGINTSIYPGRMIGYAGRTLPGSVVTENVQGETATVHDELQ